MTSLSTKLCSGLWLHYMSAQRTSQNVPRKARNLHIFRKTATNQDTIQPPPQNNARNHQKHKARVA